MRPRIPLFTRIWRAITQPPAQHYRRTGERDRKRAKATREMTGKWERRQARRAAA